MKHSTITAGTLLTLFATLACGQASGTRPHDMSTAHHDAAARQEEALAEQHEAAYDADATTASRACGGGQAPACWSSLENPTAEHQKRAEEHRRLAEEHRRASQALRDAEAASCSGLSEADRDMSPFAHDLDIRSVTRYRAEVDVPEGPDATEIASGATITVNPVPGLTRELLQRMVNCHLARNAAAGNDMPEMDYCPLVPAGVVAKVRSTGDGFAVDVSSTKPDTAAEIWRRAERLKAAR